MIGKWLVVDNAFNRAWNSHLIGQVSDSPPSYTVVRLILNESEAKRLLSGRYVYGTKLATEGTS